MNKDKKILLTTSYIRDSNDYYDWVGTNIKWKYRFSRPRKVSYALRFIKQNIPEVEILEYPTWEEYSKALDQTWDVVGYSFYLNDVEKVKQMAALARQKGVPELWGGNYGVLTDGIEEIFDKIFIGCAENEIAEYIDKKLDTLTHPPIVNALEFGPFNLSRIGVLFTTRGCTQECKFCQTPSFNPKPETIFIDAIERVLKYYRDVGIRFVGIFDENFGLYRKHAHEVVQLLNKYKLYWAAMTRADFAARQVENWKADGGRFVAAGVGIESFNAEVLDNMMKRFDPEKIQADLKTLKGYNIGILGYYIIGFDNETESSIKQDLKKLIDLKIDMSQITIVTPLPKTKLWYELESEYGIFEKDYTKFDTKHLVWNHPNISKPRMERLMDWGLKNANPRRGILRMLVRFHKLAHGSDGYSALGMFPKGMYYAKKYGTDGHKVFFDDEGGLISYRFNFES
jgi:radical SAM superfamily enzyme YgiQ (UPF0313 family)